MKLNYFKKHVKVIEFSMNGIKYRALIYINDNSTKYIRPCCSLSNEEFMIHALTMIGWM